MVGFKRTMQVAAVATGLGVVGSAAAGAPLTLKVYNADAGSFNVDAVIVSGPTEALVIDSGFTRADALRLAADVLDTGKTLKTILISNADPDYYFGAETLKQVFPQARVVATAAVRERIAERMAGKLAFWGPKMGANAPHQPIVPDLLTGNAVQVDGEVVEIRGTTGVLAARPYAWIPSLKAVVGNIAVFGNLHVWTADTQQPAERAAWFAQLDEIEALHPVTVVPGHMAAGSAMDLSAVHFTRDYLHRFDAEAARSTAAAELIAAMQQAYPQAGLGIALDIGAKVAKKEMQW